MAIVKFVSLVPLMTQVVETHMDTWKSLRTKLKYYTTQRNNVLKNYFLDKSRIFCFR